MICEIVISYQNINDSQDIKIYFLLYKCYTFCAMNAIIITYDC